MAGTGKSQEPMDEADAKKAEEGEATKDVEELADEEVLEDLGVPGEVQQNVLGGCDPTPWWTGGADPQ